MLDEDGDSYSIHRPITLTVLMTGMISENELLSPIKVIMEAGNAFKETARSLGL